MGDDVPADAVWFDITPWCVELPAQMTVAAARAVAWLRTSGAEHHEIDMLFRFHRESLADVVERWPELLKVTSFAGVRCRVAEQPTVAADWEVEAWAVRAGREFDRVAYSGIFADQL